MIVGLFAVLSLSACADEERLVDELAGAEDDGAAALGKAEQAQQSAPDAYFEVQPDFRKCLFPLCGGVFVKRVNQVSTRCADGKKADRCYVPTVSWKGLGLGAAEIDAAQGALYAGKLLVKGRIVSWNYESFGNLGQFVASEAWVAETDGEADGPFVRLTDSGARCITTPCPSIREDKLNCSGTVNIAGVDFGPSGATDAQVEQAFLDMLSPSGVIATGFRTSVTGVAGKGKARAVTKFWRRVEAAKTAPCFVGGCSAQLCSDQDGAISTCEYLPEYACYQGATCERQVDGACGWTQTDALLECLAHPPTP
jgi:hypothetical protein